jgi:ABC-type polysaccharide/polyol phosphate transport system ATPase subunit
MGAEIAISLNNVSKGFKRYAQPVDRLKEMILPSTSHAQDFWALRDISFDIMKGETMGIIGRNGAGKSTLLQLICGTLTPTRGEVQVNGRIAALLELGAGFNPEFTGRENVYMNGAIMGLSKGEVDERFDNIAAFADIKDFIDRPVKTFSSGMYVRLAFASAIHVDPDILIVDEALAVGDMFFQAKCMARMRQMMESGVTVLFVSHDVGSVKSLCQRGVFLENGHLKTIGKTSDVVASYVSLIHEDMNQELKLHVKDNKANREISIRDLAIDNTNRLVATSVLLQEKSNPKLFESFVSLDLEGNNFNESRRYGDGGARLLDLIVLDENNQSTSRIDYLQDFSIQASVIFEKDFETFSVGYLVSDLHGVSLVGTTTVVEKIEMPSVNAGEIYVFEFKTKNNLNHGIYTIWFGIELPVIENEQHIFLDVVESAAVIKIDPPISSADRFWSRTYTPVDINYKKS